MKQAYVPILHNFVTYIINKQGFSCNLKKHALVSFSKTSNSTRPLDYLKYVTVLHLYTSIESHIIAIHNLLWHGLFTL